MKKRLIVLAVMGVVTLAFCISNTTKVSAGFDDNPYADQKLPYTVTK